MEAHKVTISPLAVDPPKVQLVRRSARQSPLSLAFMIFFGMMVGGFIERAVYPQPISSSGVLSAAFQNETDEPRYCDPPRPTRCQWDNDSSAENSDEIYYTCFKYAEPNHRTHLTPEQEAYHWLWRIFIWGSVFSPVPAAWISAKFGPGRVFSFSLVTSSILGVAVSFHDDALQAALGFFQGCLLPSGLLLISASSSKISTGKYVVLLSGQKLGFGLAELVPYNVRGLIGLIVGITWYASWAWTVSTPKLPAQGTIPWRKILTSRAVRMAAIAVFGAECLQYAIFYSLRQYLDMIYYYSNRFLFLVPNVLMVFFAWTSHEAYEMLLEKTELSRTTTRRIFVYISHYLVACLLAMVCFVGCHIIAPILLFAALVIMGGADFVGAYPNVLDLTFVNAPVTVAICCTWGALGRLVPIYLTSMVFEGTLFGAWRMNLLLATLIGLVSSSLFMLKSSSRLDSWNFPKPYKTEKLPAKLSLEKCFLKIIAVPENPKFRSRACSTSLPRGPNGRLLFPKRASIS